MKQWKIYVSTEYRGAREFNNPEKAWRYFKRQVKRQGGDSLDLHVKKYSFLNRGKANFYDIVEIGWSL